MQIKIYQKYVKDATGASSGKELLSAQALIVFNDTEITMNEAVAIVQEETVVSGVEWMEAEEVDHQNQIAMVLDGPKTKIDSVISDLEEKYPHSEDTY